MKEITISGTIVSNEDKLIYDFLGIEAVSPKEIISGIQEAEGDDITFLVSSGGGDLLAGNEIYAAIKRYMGATIAEITGFAASAATVICCGADVVRANPGIQYMIHNVSSYQSGDRNDMATMSEILQTADVSIANIYRIKTGLSEKEILKMMNHGSGNSGTWMDAKRAKDLGFVDEIIGEDNCKLMPRTIYNNSLFATILSEETKEKLRDQLSGQREKSGLQDKRKARLDLLKLKGEKR